MRIPTLFLIGLAVTVAAIEAQSPSVPRDVHPESLSRLPPLTRADLTADDQKVWDYLVGVNGVMPKYGPPPVTVYSPQAAEPIQALNQYLRRSVIGSHYFELGTLIAAREFDQQYEWSGHEPAALRAGVEQRVIDAVKFNRGVGGLPEKDATLIRLGRALFREHKVTPELWAKSVELFGRQGTIEAVTVLGDYAMVGFLLTAADQQLPPDRKALLPVK
jgi:4-carboxymuconolactone decarboxylase